MSNDVADAYESDLLGFAATLTDDRALSHQLVTQAMARAADDPSAAADPAAAARVWTVRGLLSDGYLLGAPVAPDVDTAADVEDRPGDDLEARLARSSRLQRAVVALYYGRHNEAATIARIVGSSESDINAYLAGVRLRLGIDGPATADGEQSLRQLLQDRHAAELERERDLAAARVAASVAEVEGLQARLGEHAERERRSAEQRQAETARTDGLVVDLQQRLDTALAAGGEVQALDQQRQATIAELERERDLAAARETAAAAEVEGLQTRLDEHAEHDRRSAEQRQAETARTDGLVVDLQQRLDTALAAGGEVQALDQQRQATIAELTRERDLAAAREAAAAAQIESLQTRLDEHAEHDRRSAEQRLVETAGTDELIVDLRQRLDTALAAGGDVEALDHQRQATIAELTRERDLAAAREAAAAAQIESLQTRLDEHGEQLRRSAEELGEETRRADEVIVDLRQRLDTALAAAESTSELDEQHEQAVAELTRERDLAVARETALTAQIDSLQSRLDEHAEHDRRSAEERLDETAHADGLIVDLRQRLDTALASGERTSELDEQRTSAVAELAHERDLAAARETTLTTRIQDLQSRLDEHAEQARRSAQERLDDTRSTDEVIADLRQRLDTAQAVDRRTPMPAARAAQFEAARPFAFTAIGPVDLREPGPMDPVEDEIATDDSTNGEVPSAGQS